jgi:hypothetical protein
MPLAGETLLAALDGLGFANPGGTEISYSNLGYQILGLLIGRATSTPYTAYMQREVLAPLGMKSATFDPATVPPDRLAVGYEVRRGEFVERSRPTPPGAAAAAGELWASVVDLAALAAFELDAWPPRGDPDHGVRRGVRSIVGRVARLEHAQHLDEQRMELRQLALADRGRELRLELCEHREAREDAGPPAMAREPDPFRARIVRIRDPLDHAHLDQLVDQRRDRLLADADALRELGEPRTREIDVGEERGVGAAQADARALADPRERLLVEQPRALEQHLPEARRLRPLEGAVRSSRAHPPRSQPTTS